MTSEIFKLVSQQAQWLSLCQLDRRDCTQATAVLLTLMFASGLSGSAAPVRLKRLGALAKWASSEALLTPCIWWSRGWLPWDARALMAADS